MDHGHMFPDVTPELARKRRELAPDTMAAFREFGNRFSEATHRGRVSRDRKHWEAP